MHKNRKYSRGNAKTLRPTLRSYRHAGQQGEWISKFEPPHGKTNNLVSDQVGHKPVCAVTETGLKLEILELSRRGIVLSE